MKHTYTKEEIFNALPDFVNSKLDSDLANEIELRASQDESLKKQIDELRKTFAFLNNSDFSNPPDNYFSNLSVKINERIGEKEKLSWWEKLGLAWKIAIPAVAVVALIFALMLGGTQKDKNQLAVDTGKTPTDNVIASDVKDLSGDQTPSDPLKSIGDEQMSANEPKVNNDFRSDRSSDNSVAFDFQSDTGTDVPLMKAQVVADNFEEVSESDTYETSMLPGTTETEEPVVDEFLELSPDEQKEILEILKNS